MLSAFTRIGECGGEQRPRVVELDGLVIALLHQRRAIESQGWCEHLVRLLALILFCLLRQRDGKLYPNRTQSRGSRAEQARSRGSREPSGSRGSVRPGKVEYSSGCESRPSKVGQPLGSELWTGGSNPKS